MVALRHSKICVPRYGRDEYVCNKQRNKLYNTVKEIPVERLWLRTIVKKLFIINKKGRGLFYTFHTCYVKIKIWEQQYKNITQHKRTEKNLYKIYSS